MKIRKATPKDVKGCLALQKLDKEKYWKPSDFKKAISDKDVVFLVLEENKIILGYSIGFIVPTKRTDALVHETRVDKRERGKKIGTKLVDELCKNLFKNGVKDIYAQIKREHIKFYINSCKFKKSDTLIDSRGE